MSRESRLGFSRPLSAWRSPILQRAGDLVLPEDLRDLLFRGRADDLEHVRNGRRPLVCRGGGHTIRELLVDLGRPLLESRQELVANETPDQLVVLHHR